MRQKNGLLTMHIQYAHIIIIIYIYTIIIAPEEKFSQAKSGHYFYFSIIFIIQPHLTPATTPDPEPSQPWPRCTDMMPEPTNDTEPEPASMSMPGKKGLSPPSPCNPNPQKCLTRLWSV